MSCFDTGLAGLHNNDHLVYADGRTATKVFDAGLHVEKDPFFSMDDEMTEERLEKGVLGAGTSTATPLDGSHDQQLDALVLHTVLLRNIVYLGIHLEEGGRLAHLRARSLGNQTFKFPDRNDVIRIGDSQQGC